MTCPNCNSTNVNEFYKAKRAKLESEPDVEFIDIHLVCNDCKYSFNCVGAKKINIS